jgi:hypothetical protein
VAALKEAWRKVLEGLIDRLIDSMPRVGFGVGIDTIERQIQGFNSGPQFKLALNCLRFTN